MAAIPQTLGSAQEQLLGAEITEHVTLGQDAWRRLRRNRLAVIGLVIISFFVVTALVSFVWTPYPTWRQALGPTYQGPSLIHPLGLDDYGRDILSRVMGGAAIALAVGVGASFLASLTGIILGLLAGFFKGKVDALISLIINIFYGVPDLLVALILVVLIGRGLFNIIMASEGYKALQIAPHIVLAPCAALSLTVLAFNWLGDGLRDAIDPRMRR